jgi:ABC-type branched-subunit amino acid transport system ATPase component
MTVLENVALGAYPHGAEGVSRSVIRFTAAGEGHLMVEAVEQIRRVVLDAHMRRSW